MHPPRRWIPFALIALTLICYCRLFKADFTLFDDTFTVQYNPLLNPPSANNVWSYWKLFQHSGKVNGAYGLYIPLTYTYWSAIAVVARTPDLLSPGSFELNPYLFHIGNVLMHACSGVLVFAILRRLLQSAWPACAAAMVFLLHPVQVEAVAWISGAKDLLAGVLALVAAWEHLQLRSATNPTGRQVHYAMMLLASVGAMLAKPSAIMLPVILLIMDRLLLKRTMRQSLLVLSPIFLIAIIFAILGVLAQDIGDVPRAPLWARPLVVGDALAFYVYKLVVPLWLCIDYGHSPSMAMSRLWFYLTWLIPAVIGFVVCWARRTKPLLLAGAMIFIVAAAPTLGFTTFLFQRFSTTADHYLYLPMLGVACIVAGFLEGRKPRIVWPGVAVVIIALGSLSFVQTEFWLSDRALFLHTATINPKSFMAQADLASDAMRSGNLEEAEHRLQLCRECQPLMEMNLHGLQTQLQQMKASTHPGK
jgi:hypothetical protein